MEVSGKRHTPAALTPEITGTHWIWSLVEPNAGLDSFGGGGEISCPILLPENKVILVTITSSGSLISFISSGDYTSLALWPMDSRVIFTHEP
jgi:heme/copper-type cytochrome/quinol oxidase subunit 2